VETVACGVGVASLGRSSADRNQRENGNEANNRSDNEDESNSKRQSGRIGDGVDLDFMSAMFAVVHGC
jgi:hypothetical protein